MKGSSGEYIIGDPKGIWKTRTVRRRPDEEKWHRDNLQLVGGVPWRLSVNDPKVDGEALKMDVPEAGEMSTKDVEEDSWKLVAPRQLYLRKSDFDKHGFSQGCMGCRSLLRGTARQAHSEACRTRMGREMTGHERAKKVEGRAFEFFLARPWRCRTSRGQKIKKGRRRRSGG